jgi:hypothetical protein
VVDACDCDCILCVVVDVVLLVGMNVNACTFTLLAAKIVAQPHNDSTDLRAVPAVDEDVDVDVDVDVDAVEDLMLKS